MTRRALLVGSATGGLVGVDTDVALLQDELGRRGFDAVRVLAGTDATRAGILDGLRRLISETQGGDDVVVAYSGHGARVPFAHPDARLAAGQGGYLHFVVPTDFAQSTTTDFRGVLAGELSQVPMRPLAARALVGLLRHFLETPVNEVNAPSIAKDRGIHVREVRSAEPHDWASLVTLTVRGQGGEIRVAGTVYGKREARIVRSTVLRNVP